MRRLALQTQGKGRILVHSIPSVLAYATPSLSVECQSGVASIGGRMQRTVCWLLAICSFVGVRGVRGTSPMLARVKFFESKIRPVLIDQCYECHATEAKKVRGGLLVDSRDGLLKGGDSGPAIVPGKPDESLLLAALKYEDFEMPPKGKLGDEVIRNFEQWIREGAVDPRTGPAARRGEDD